MRAVVTGGAGFIGSHLVEELLKRRWAVTVIDNLSTGRIENISFAMGEKNFRFVESSVLNTDTLRDSFKGADVVFHLAASVGVKRIVDNPIETIRANVLGTDAVLSVASESGSVVLLASSSEVYGKAGNRPFCEDDDLLFGATTRSRWSYGCSKAIDEFLALAYHTEKGLKVVIVRFFNIVGERQRGEYGMVLPRFVHQALKGGPLSVYGDGEQVRTFCYVKDAVKALLLLIESDSVGRIVNLGSPHPIKIKELAETVRRMVNPKAGIELVPYEAVYGEGFEDIRYRVPDLSLLKSLINYVPQTPIEEIIRRIRDYIAA